MEQILEKFRQQYPTGLHYNESDDCTLYVINEEKICFWIDALDEVIITSMPASDDYSHYELEKELSNLNIKLIEA